MKKTLILSILLASAGYGTYGQDTYASGSSFGATTGGPPAGGYRTGDQACFVLDLGTTNTALNYNPATGRELYLGLTVSNLRDITLTLTTDNGGLATSFFDIVQEPQPNGFQTIVHFTQNATVPPMGFNSWNVCGIVIGTPPGTGSNISYSTTMDEGAYTNPDPTNDEPYSSTAATLPVKLVNFGAAREGSGTLLTWATTEEVNSAYFEVQHSSDAGHWRTLGKVLSKGESSIHRDYSFVHTAPSNGNNYYRLRMVDKDASYAYSPIARLHFSGRSETTAGIYPNPVSDRLFVKNADLIPLREVQVLDLDGRVLLKGPPSKEGFTIKGLTTGLYIVKLIGEDGSSSSHKLLVN